MSFWKSTLERLHSQFVEFLSTLTKAEEELLRAIAKNQPVLYPRGHDFIKKLKQSSASAGKILKRFEDHALVYNTDDGYVLADPLLALFIKEKW